MDSLLKALRDELQKIINNIDDGNSNLSGGELLEALVALKKFTEKDTPMTKYQAAEYLHVSRATFDNLVASKELPQGVKLYQGDSNIFWYKKDLDSYKRERDEE